jgi:hypothetical protein
MTKTLTRILILSGVVLLNTIAVDAGSQQVTVRVSPKHAYAPADIIVYVVLEKNADNRTLRVSAESSDFFRSSELQLDGESAARVMILHFRELPPGDYDVTADVRGPNGRTREKARCEITVL